MRLCQSGKWRIGRVYVADDSEDLPDYRLHVDEDAGRLTGASAAGLVVGAMGVLVFALYLRTWSKQRQATGTGVASSGRDAGAGEPPPRLS